VVLENARGMRLALIDYGATIVAADIADRNGKRSNIVLSLPTLKAYEQTKRQYASIVGRFAGRISNARYTLDGKTVQLQANPLGATLHGGPPGYEHKVWKREDFTDAKSVGVIYHLRSPDGDQKFPGNLDITVTYRLMLDSDEFQIAYKAVTDKPTVLNLTNHAFFNLGGANAGPAAMQTHRIQIDADRTTETRPDLIPTGKFLNVAGTPLDLRKPVDYLPRVKALPDGFDHTYVLSRKGNSLARAVLVEDTASGRRMEILTTEPSVQIYSGNSFDGTEIGGEGAGYQQHGGFALETQHLPDSPNQPSFPTTALYPGKTFESLTTYRFSAAAGK
jgi:aldose 1-epimerase